MSQIHRETSPRSSRGKVLIVGDHAVLPPTLEGRVTVRVPDMFCAIGELASATARDPVDVVLISSETVNGNAASATDALHRVDPAVQIVVSEEERGTSESPDGSASSASPEQTSDAQSSPIHQSQVVASSASAPEPEARAEPLSAPASMSAQLGDIDLVDAVRSSTAGVRDAALLLMQQHTGWSDLVLLEKPGDIQSAIVCCDKQCFGWIASQQAEEAQLRLWADWLARWLALDASYQQFRHMAHHDELTGARNRRYFHEFLSECMKSAAQRRRPVTVMLFDIDDFKLYNDTYGHAAGDEILRETVRLLESVIRKGDRVCRIGGDEFAVVFADPEGPREIGSNHPENVEQIAQRFQDQICRMKFPKLAMDAPATLSVSAGLATYPWDGATPEALLEHADQLALQSKRRGKNAITLGPGAQQVCRIEQPIQEDDGG